MCIRSSWSMQRDRGGENDAPPSTPNNQHRYVLDPAHEEMRLLWTHSKPRPIPARPEYLLDLQTEVPMKFLDAIAESPFLLFVARACCLVVAAIVAALYWGAV